MSLFVYFFKSSLPNGYSFVAKSPRLVCYNKTLTDFNLTKSIDILELNRRNCGYFVYYLRCIKEMLIPNIVGVSIDNISNINPFNEPDDKKRDKKEMKMRNLCSSIKFECWDKNVSIMYSFYFLYYK